MPDEVSLFEDVPPDHRSGMVSIVGRANVGKSTLINRLLGEKLSIVSPVAQTTRNVIRGIHTEKRGQIVFLDTPGVHRAKVALGKTMNKMARGAAEGVDVNLLVFDSSEPPELEDDGWMRRAIGRNLPCVAVLNKMDLGGGHAEDYKALWAELCTELELERDILWWEASAIDGENTDELLEHLFTLLPFGPLLFPPDILSDFPQKLAVSDIIREKYLDDLYDELPHHLGVWVRSITENEHGELDIFVRVYVDRPSHKGIVIGQRGRLLRKVKRAATLELEELYEKPVRLDITVKVEKGWTENHFILRQLGYR